jgi:hypothetical protein
MSRGCAESKLVRLRSSTKFISYLIVFFSHNKSMNGPQLGGVWRLHPVMKSELPRQESAVPCRGGYGSATFCSFASLCGLSKQ